MIPAVVVALLLIGGRPHDASSVDRIDVEPDLSFTAIGPDGGPGIALESGARRFEFRAGTAPQVGRVEIPLPGDRLIEWGASHVELEVRGDGSREIVELLLVGADDVFHAPIDLSLGEWHTRRWTLADLPSRGDPASAMGDARPRVLRFESRPQGLSTDCALEVRRISFLRDDEPARSVRASGSSPGPAARFSFGVWSLAGNRSLLEEVALHGVNTVVEYGPATWPRAVVEDHLAFAHACGIGLVVNLHDGVHGRDVNADGRIRDVADQPGFLAWHLMDEPDVAHLRGVPPDRSAPSFLAQRSRALPGPVLVNCLESFSLSRYAGAGDVFSTDYYWPSSGWYPSPLVIASHAESVVEIAERAGGVPWIVLQLASSLWRDAAIRQSPASLRAQVLAGLVSGIRGVTVFEAAIAVRWAEAGLEEGDIWPEFLRLAEDVSTWEPLLARWRRTAELTLEPALGDVRAAAFEDGGDRWIVFVNLGVDASDIRLGGPALEGATAIADPRDGWRREIPDGVWEDRVEGLTGRLVRVERDPAGAGAGKPVDVVSVIPTTGREPLRFDRCVVGACLEPAPDAGSMILTLDGRPLDARTQRGPAATIRCVVQDLADGSHTASVRWRAGGESFEHAWTFDVEAPRLPLFDDFSREELGPRWTPIDTVRWDPFDPACVVAAGGARIERGELLLESTGGAFGVILRGIEAPESLRITWTVRTPERATCSLRRNELTRSFPVEAGTHRVEWTEDVSGQRVLVDGRPAGAWHPTRDHRGGVIGFGVGAGTSVWIDDVRLESPAGGR